MGGKNNQPVTIIGGGLAGSEASWQMAGRGFAVRLFEMRPHQSSPAHQSDRLGELVCSNSLRAIDRKNAVGLLKEEMRLLNSLIIGAADRHAIPGGGALVVDREGFSREITAAIEGHPLIELIRGEVRDLEVFRRETSGPILFATGPLTSPSLAEGISSLTESERLYFYDSIAPILEVESIDQKIAFRASRYEKGEAAYLNCPMSQGEYEAFVDALLAAEKVETQEFDRPKFFEGCLPIEVMAERGRYTLAFGPMKPVGLTDPRTGKRPFAVVQLRQDDLHASLYNMVGFQTRMKYPEQKRIFRMIPGLEQAEFARLGSMHRNTFIHSPSLLNDQLQLRKDPQIFFAGQITGVEGYVESAAMGLYAGLALSRHLIGEKARPPDASSALGALIRHITRAPGDFQPMNINFGLMDIPDPLRGKGRREVLADHALEKIGEFKTQFDDFSLRRGSVGEKEARLVHG